jgi:hypothetical protein
VITLSPPYPTSYWEGHASTRELFEVLKKVKLVEEVWRAEMARRIADIDTGRATLMPHFEVQREIRRILEHGS